MNKAAYLLDLRSFAKRIFYEGIPNGPISNKIDALALKHRINGKVVADHLGCAVDWVFGQK